MTSERHTDPTSLDPATVSPVEPVASAGARRSLLRRPAALVAAGLAVVLTAGGAVAATAAHKTVELDVDGEVTTVPTFAGTVDGALAQAGVEVAPRDAVTPGLDAPIHDGTEIVVRLASSLDVIVGGRIQTVWTTAPSAAEALADLQASGRDATVVISRSYARASLDLPLVVEGTVTIVVDGEEESVTVDEPSQVEDVLALAEVTLGELDRSVLSIDDDGAPVITVSRVERGERVETETVSHDVREQSDGTLYKGQRRVLEAGSDGTIERTYRTMTVDGEETVAILLEEKVTAEPVTEVVAVGTKERPAAAAPSSSGGSSSGGSSSSASYSGSGVWGALAQCESGGNPSAVSANGLYYGLYQFSLGTWAAVGGSGLPSQASPAEQTQRAQTLQARSGWGQWPHCAAKLGLL